MLQIKHRNLLLSFIFLFIFTGIVTAQVDSVKQDTTVQVDSAGSVKQDTTVQVDSAGSVKQDTTGTPQQKDDEKKKRTKQSYILYGQVNLDDLQVSSSDIESSSAKPGWTLGFSYRRGGFFYWQLGVQYNNAKYGLRETGTDTTNSTFTVSNLGIPITAGINLLPFMNRVFNVRLFLSGIPSFRLKVGDNEFGVTKDNTNSFIFYGQAGVGIDVLFLVVEAGYNYGFNDLLKDDKSNPSQAFVKLGFRF